MSNRGLVFRIFHWGFTVFAVVVYTTPVWSQMTTTTCASSSDSVESQLECVAARNRKLIKAGTRNKRLVSTTPKTVANSSNKQVRTSNNHVKAGVSDSNKDNAVSDPKPNVSARPFVIPLSSIEIQLTDALAVKRNVFDTPNGTQSQKNRAEKQALLALANALTQLGACAVEDSPDPDTSTGKDSRNDILDCHSAKELAHQYIFQWSLDDTTQLTKLIADLKGKGWSSDEVAGWLMLAGKNDVDMRAASDTLPESSHLKYFITDKLIPAAKKGPRESLKELESLSKADRALVMNLVFQIALPGSLKRPQAHIILRTNPSHDLNENQVFARNQFLHAIRQLLVAGTGTGLCFVDGEKEAPDCEANGIFDARLTVLIDKIEGDVRNDDFEMPLSIKANLCSMSESHDNKEQCFSDGESPPSLEVETDEPPRENTNENGPFNYTGTIDIGQAVIDDGCIRREVIYNNSIAAARALFEKLALEKTSLENIPFVSVQDSPKSGPTASKTTVLKKDTAMETTLSSRWTAVAFSGIPYLLDTRKPRWSKITPSVLDGAFMVGAGVSLGLAVKFRNDFNLGEQPTLQPYNVSLGFALAAASSLLLTRILSIALYKTKETTE